MLAEIGIATVFLAFIAAVYAAAAGIYGARVRSERIVISARNAAIATFPLLLSACAALVVALLQGHYEIAYVWSVSNPQTPPFYRFTALWGSQSGSLLFWSLLLSGYSCSAILFNWKSDRRLMPYVIAYTMTTLAFFLGLKVFVENPFDRYWALNGQVVATTFIPQGGQPIPPQNLSDTAQGLNPLLRHFGMIIHPPMLYMGFTGFMIPFAFAMAALASGDLSTNWIHATRRWTLVAWLFLSLGLILGGRWAYDVLGWGGYWGWDPVENAAFLPWLVGTAFLHSVVIQEKRGMLKVWNMFLVIGAFSAMVFGTFATRSGLVDSVHSFARSPIGVPMFVFWAAVTLVSVTLILWRRNRGELDDEHPFVNILSRESLFVLNNIVFVILVVAIFWGSFGAPVISELFGSTKITLGTEYFMMVTPPLFAALYILMGVAPLTAWGATSLPRIGRGLAIPFLLTLITLIFFVIGGMGSLGALFGYGVVVLAGYVALYEMYRGVVARVKRDSSRTPLTYLRATLDLFGRNRRRYGGYVVHLGITIIGIGVIGSTVFQQQTQRTLNIGETLSIGGYELRYDGITHAIADDGRQMDIADVTVFRSGQTQATLRPRTDHYLQADGTTMPMTIAGAYSTLENDFYVLLIGWEQQTANTATFKVYINPLINLVWWGGLILIFGTVIAAWPAHEESRVHVSYPVKNKAGARA
ncbi:MAG: cytochrome c-type biogenesis CcmF C-terminal domain-containing protein [Anaerolineae bacterium]